MQYTSLENGSSHGFSVFSGTAAGAGVLHKQANQSNTQTLAPNRIAHQPTCTYRVAVAVAVGLFARDVNHIHGVRPNTVLPVARLGGRPVVWLA